MSEDAPKETQAAEAGGGGCRACGFGCLGTVLLCAIVFGVVSASASATLDARFLAVGEEIAEIQQEANAPRTTVVGAPANDENAVIDYQGLEWILTSGKAGLMRRESWKVQAPELPDDIDAMLKRANPDGREVDYFLVMAGLLAETLDPEGAGKAEAMSKRLRRAEAEAAFKKFRPALRYVRDGLRRGKCDWKTRWERGFRFEAPNRLCMQAVASLMAYEASLQPPSEAIQTGLEIVAFGQDLSRQGLMIDCAIGAAISRNGFKSLAHTMGRPGCKADDYARVISALSDYRTQDPDQILARERMTAVVTALELSGRRFDPKDTEYFEEQGGFLAKFSVFHVRELDGYEHFMGREIEVSRMTPGEREAAHGDLRRDLDGSSYFLAKVAMPNLVEVQERLLEADVLARITRVLAAAHLQRLERGAFPADIGDVAKSLGVGAQDIFSPTPGTPLLYALVGGEARCWSVGRNQVSEGGPEGWTKSEGGSDDCGFRSRAPVK